MALGRTRSTGSLKESMIMHWAMEQLHLQVPAEKVKKQMRWLHRLTTNQIKAWTKTNRGKAPKGDYPTKAPCRVCDSTLYRRALNRQGVCISCRRTAEGCYTNKRRGKLSSLDDAFLSHYELRLR